MQRQNFTSTSSAKSIWKLLRFAFVLAVFYGMPMHSVSIAQEVHRSGSKDELTELKRQIERRQSLAMRFNKLLGEIDEQRKTALLEAELFNAEKPADYGNATKEGRAMLIQNCLQKLMSARIEIAGNEALLGNLAKSYDEDTAKESKKADPVLAERLDMLNKQREMLLKKSVRMQKLLKERLITSAELEEIELAHQKVEGDINILKAEIKNNSRSQLSRRTEQIADLLFATTKLKAMETAATQELRKIGSVDKVGAKNKDQNLKLELLREKRKLLVRKVAELSVEIEELKNLVSFVESKRGKPAKETSQKN